MLLLNATILLGDSAGPQTMNGMGLVARACRAYGAGRLGKQVTANGLLSLSEVRRSGLIMRVLTLLTAWTPRRTLLLRFVLLGVLTRRHMRLHPPSVSSVVTVPL